MTPLRNIRLVGGPDARLLRVIDMDTGDIVPHVVKVELLIVPNNGALVNITQACRLADLDVVARDAGEPIIDLPDDHPDAESVAEVLARHPGPAPAGDMSRFFDASLGKPFESAPVPVSDSLSSPARKVFQELAALATPAQQLQEAAEFAVAGGCGTESLRMFRDKHLGKPVGGVPDAQIDAPPALPATPSEKARRAPAPGPDEVPLALPITPAVPVEPDLSDEDKAELTMLLASQVEQHRAQLPPGTKWPFPPAAEIGRPSKKVTK